MVQPQGGNGRDYYEILGVPTNASEAQIKAAYRELAGQYHPDVSPTPQAEPMMKLINEAYETLGKPKKRQFYDFSRRAQSTTAGMSQPFSQRGAGVPDVSDEDLEARVKKWAADEMPLEDLTRGLSLEQKERLSKMVDGYFAREREVMKSQAAAEHRKAMEEFERQRDEQLRRYGVR